MFTAGCGLGVCEVAPTSLCVTYGFDQRVDEVVVQLLAPQMVYVSSIAIQKRHVLM